MASASQTQCHGAQAFDGSVEMRASARNHRRYFCRVAVSRLFVANACEGFQVPVRVAEKKLNTNPKVLS